MAKDIVQELNDKIAYAKELHTTAHDRMREWETLYKAEYEIAASVADTAQRHDGNKVYKPSEPRAIVNKYLAVFNLQEIIQAQVLPNKETDREERVCSKLERFLNGYQRRVQQEARKPIFRHAVWYGLVRGKMMLQAQFVPELVKTDRFPLRSIAVDPLTVFEVASDNGILYFVREYERYAMDLQLELGRKGKGWNKLKEDYDDTDLITVTEYWDGEYYACTANKKGIAEDGELIHEPQEHNYGFCPLAVAHLEDTPLDAPQDQFASPIGIIADALKEDAAFINTLSQAVDKFFFPLGIYKGMDGKPVVLDPYAKGDLQPVAPDSKIEWYTPTANVPILEKYLSVLRGHIAKFTFPEVSFAEGGSSESGFARAQALSQVKDRVDDKVRNLNLAFGWHFGQVLRLAETFYPDVAESGGWQVAAVEARTGGKNSRAMVSVTDKDIDEHYDVLCHITPEMPSDRMQTIQEITALRARDPVTRKPIVDDKTLREMHPEIFEHPDEINQRIDEETFAQELPEVKQWYQQEWYVQWRKDHPVQSENKDDLSKLSKQDLIALVKMAQMQIQNPQAFQTALGQMGASLQGGQPMGGQPPMNGQAAPGQGAPMLPPQMLPPQMQNGNAAPMNPDEVMMQQMAGAMNPPKPQGV